MENLLTQIPTPELKIGDLVTYTTVFHRGKLVTSWWLVVDFSVSSNFIEYVHMLLINSDVDYAKAETPAKFERAQLEKEFTAPAGSRILQSFWRRA